MHTTLLCGLALFSFASAAQAQIVFQAPVPITTTDGSQILTNGTYFDAVGFNGGGANITVDGITFHTIFPPTGGGPGDADISFSSPTGIGGGTDGDGTGTPFKDVLNGVAYVGDFNAADVMTGTVTISNLVEGDEYQVQVFNGAGGDKTLLHGTAADNSYVVAAAYSVGDFVAGSSGTQTFTFDSSVSGIGAIGAIVVEQVPEPSTWAMMLGGLAILGFGARSLRRA